jgi:bla regulator protein BlaR1
MMLSVVVKATIIMMLALAGVAAARRSRASVRHLILAAAFVILLGFPFGIWLVPPVELQVPRVPTAIPIGFLEPAAVSTPMVVEVTTAGLSNTTSIPPPKIIAVTWAVGTILFSFPIAAGLWQLRRIRHLGSTWPRGRAMSGDGVDVLLHDAVTGPMTCGIVRPMIVFPPDAESWGDAALERALIHELEHVRRRDCVMHVAARLVCAMYWFHPLVWISWRRLCLEAERACDDAVLRHSEAPEYAEQLVTIAKHMTSASRIPHPAMARRSDLRLRVAAVLDATQRRGRAGTVCITIALAAAVLLVGIISPLRAVQGGSQEFEVASIKKNSSGRGPYNLGLSFEPNGRFQVTNAPLVTLINIAYGLTYKQLDANGFALGDQAFDVDARAPENTVPQDPEARKAQLRVMMQKLLEDRFKLAIHKKATETPLYALVVAKNGPRLKPAVPDPKCPQPDSCPSIVGPARGFKGRGVELKDVAAILTAFVDRPVVDRTGIHGRFDIDLPPWSRSPLQSPGPGELDGTEPAPDPLNPSIFEVLQEHLGLKLEAARGPHDVYVVNHVEPPTEN